MTTSHSSSTLADSEQTGTAGQQSPLAEAGQQAGDTVGHLAERATGIGLMQADRGRTVAADGLAHVAESIRRISLDMQTDQPAIADVAETAADKAEQVAEYLRTTDARQMLANVENAARRQPLLFLGGAFVLGVAASRIFKAAGNDASSGQAQGVRSANGSYAATEAGGREWLDTLPAGEISDARA